MKKESEKELLVWPFWPADAPRPGMPEHLIKARRKENEVEQEARIRIFWEDYDRARQQGLAELEVRYRALRHLWRRLDLLKRQIARPLALVLKALAEGQLPLPWEDGRTVVARGQPGERELDILNEIGELQGQKPRRARELPALEMRQQGDFLEITLRALPRSRAKAASDGVSSSSFFEYSHRWPRWLPRPFRLTLPLKDAFGSSSEPETALRRELAMLTQLPFTLRTLLTSGPLEEQLLWELGIVAAARWHLVIGFDPPRDRPELLLSEKDRELRARLLSENKRKRQQALFELFQQAYNEEHSDGPKKLPNLAWDRIIKRVAFRLEALYLSPEDIGYSKQDFDPYTPGRAKRWRDWFDQRRWRLRRRPK